MKIPHVMVDVDDALWWYIKTIISIIPKSNNLSEFGSNTKTKYYIVSDFRIMDVIVVICHQRVCCIFTSKYQVIFHGTIRRWYASHQYLILYQTFIHILNQILIEYQTLRRRMSWSIYTIKEHMVPCRKNTMCFMMVAF